MAFYNLYSIGASGTSPAGAMLASSITLLDVSGNVNILGDVASDKFSTSYAPFGNSQLTYLGIGTSGGITGFEGSLGAGARYLFVVRGTTVPASSVFTLVADVPSQVGTQWNLSTAQRNCFLAATAIATPEGPRPVETLAAGDLVRTADGVVRPVRWAGRTLVSRVFADPVRLLPVRVRAGALGDGLPVRDLLVSPGHALRVDGLLVHAQALINGRTILRETDMPLVFAYHHVELDSHDLLLAEGVAAESFLASRSELAASAWDARDWAVRCALPDHEPVEMTLPRVKSARQLPPAVRARLAGLALDVAQAA